uniref:Putative secreted protein n=1 Tax=Anopheles darlingi TaxID=43151 RepID=A0A2M4DHA8_ANODA
MYFWKCGEAVVRCLALLVCPLISIRLCCMCIMQSGFITRFRFVLLSIKCFKFGLRRWGEHSCDVSLPSTATAAS